MMEQICYHTDTVIANGLIKGFELLHTENNSVAFDKVSLVVQDIPLFKKISFTIPQDKITVIAGPSGVGKTTLLRLMSGLLVPDSGRIIVNRQEMQHFKLKQLYELRRNMGMLFQSSALFSGLNVFENIAFPLREHLDLPEAILRPIVLLKLQAVGLRGAAKLFPFELSGGMMRRVALARALIMDPKLMLYDEPLTGQDPITVGVLLRLIRKLNDYLGLTSIVVSHQIHYVKEIADYMILVAQGRVIAHGSMQSMLASKDPMVAQFVQGQPDGVVPFHYPSMPLEEELL
jgi:phospholipid/cholesterol/gamma-HCH transport system ATP-binding protein